MYPLKTAIIAITLFFVMPLFTLHAQTAIPNNDNSQLQTGNIAPVTDDVIDNTSTPEGNTPELTATQIQTLPSLPFATIEGLNKITAKATPILAQVGELVNFGNLEANIHYCWQSPPEEEPEHKALISIFEHVPGEDRKRIFHGWMFASTPGISSLEHPIYDITLLSCDKDKPASDNTAATN